MLPNRLQKLKMSNNNDSVNNPKHYNSGKFEVIDVIEDWKLGFNLGNCIKYIGRAGKKDPAKEIEDLKKAKWYLERQISLLEGNKVVEDILEKSGLTIEQIEKAARDNQEAFGPYTPNIRKPSGAI